MGHLGTNQALAREVVARLQAARVRTFCLCPGGRNAPLVQVLTTLGSDVEVLDFFDERSASFFALGRARRDGRPAAVVTTSGTACAELLPAMVEAYYSSVALVALTADRPRSYRGTAAPQAIEQPGIFGIYARQSLDLDRPGGEWELASVDGPSHVNVCFDEPLLADWVDDAAAGVARSSSLARDADQKVGAPSHDTGVAKGVGFSAERFGGPADAERTWASSAVPSFVRPLVLLGALQDAGDQEDVLDFCRRLGAPVLAEAASGLTPRLGALLFRGGETAVRRGFDLQIFDSVVRIGDIPSCRTWRDLEVKWRVPVVSASRRRWAGLTHAAHRHVPAGVALSRCLPHIEPFPAGQFQALAATDRQAARIIDMALTEFPRSEPAFVRALSRGIPERSFVYLGNSQPIREWNQFAVVEERGFVLGANRGANGIDGQVSTFLGQAGGGRENWAVVGDLTALYDLQGPWALRHAATPVRIVVLNNCGGRIFERMFANSRFQNRHALSFDAFAALWGCDYRCVEAVEEGWLTGALAPASVIEMRPDESQTGAFWRTLRDGGVL